jgi:hypothetical protein
MPTGLSNSPGLSGSGGIIGKGATSATGGFPRAAINRTFRLIFTSGTVPQPSQAMSVPPSCNLYIRANNGTSTGNKGNVYVGLSREEILRGQGNTISPDTEINYPVDNTFQIWGMGEIGDGIEISIRAAAQ